MNDTSFKMKFKMSIISNTLGQAISRMKTRERESQAISRLN